jgi:hypothetical protein
MSFFHLLSLKYAVNPVSAVVYVVYAVELVRLPRRQIFELRTKKEHGGVDKVWVMHMAAQRSCIFSIEI